ncbi:hypothetical protein [Palleronia sp. LCG004]|uniref:hypothetical protein n=1 Tax=Palleronia sp. LCG004 TaxID=3079304 RepID=UPI002943D9A2|nr:hypothetical protein [Palleronia sp. LCG004]WOI56730.1 hypothetical protein RVY76_02725 [Palleronia sp. LCG004]
MIKEVDIRQWADRTEARALLPVLVRKIIRETTPTLTSIRFPGNDAIALPGLDGETMADLATLWVPKGTALWEMGCNQNPSAKANGDYDKRTAEVAAEVRHTSHFAFVTPRRWSGKAAWLREKRDRGEWGGVLAWDAVDLETWLDEAPTTRLWLAEQLGFTQHGLATPEDWFRGWASAATPNISVGLVAGGRSAQRDTLVEKLRAGDRIVPVVADGRQEAVAFCIAALLEADAVDLLDRMTIVTSPEAVPGAGIGAKPILVLDLPGGESPAAFDRDRFQVIRPMARGEVPEREPLELRHVGADAFRTALEKMGLPEDTARSRALEVGHSVTVLRRRLADDPAVRQPHWSSKPSKARLLIPHALVGGWVDGKTYDDASFLSLLGETSEAEAIRASATLSQGEDAPLVRIGAVTTTVSQVDALFAIGRHVERADLDRFFVLVADAVGERDPKLDLPEDQWWCANIHGKSRTYSGALLSGLGDTLGILSAFGNVICGDRLQIDLRGRIDRLVRDLMSDMTPDAWISIRPHLRALAEAAPHAFLDCVEADLDRPAQPISAIMRCVGTPGLSQECLRTELLWSLEALAWSPQHFARAAEIVLRLCTFEAEDNYANTAPNTAAALFRDWLPSTLLDVEARMDVLQRIAPRHRLAAIGVCASLLPSRQRSGSRTAMPRWPNAVEAPRWGTNRDCWIAQRVASGLMLDLAPLAEAELGRVLEVCENLHPDDLVRLAAEVGRWAEAANDGARAAMAKVLHSAQSRLRFALRRVGDDPEGVAHVETTGEALKRMTASVRPVDPRERHRWLFENHHVGWVQLDDDEIEGRIDWREREARVETRRRDALEEIEAGHGRNALYPFALSFDDPTVVARTLAGYDAPDDHKVNWAALALEDNESDRSNQFLAQILFIPDDEERLARIVSSLEDGDQLATEASRRRLGRVLPNARAGWRLAERIGGPVRMEYWATASITLFREDGAAEGKFVARRLLEAGRARSAFSATHYEVDALAPETWLEILEAILRGDEPDGPIPQRHELENVFKLLDDAPNVSDTQIASLEWPFAKLLENYGAGSGRPAWAMHRLMMADPSEYVGLLRWAYPRNDDLPEPEFDVIDPDQREMRATTAYHVLASWSQIPGTRPDGAFDGDEFRNWFARMRELATEHGRLGVACVRLADCLARVAKLRGFDDWLPEVVFDVLDQPSAAQLREAMWLAVHNARGVTSRGPYDGGAQERELAKRYRTLSTRCCNSHPRVAAMLEEIAKSFDRDAEREDQQAQLSERWHP